MKRPKDLESSWREGLSILLPTSVHFCASFGGAGQSFSLHNDGGYAGQFEPVPVFAEATVFPGVWPLHCDFSEVPGANTGGVREENTRWGARSCGEGLRA